MFLRALKSKQRNYQAFFLTNFFIKFSTNFRDDFQKGYNEAETFQLGCLPGVWRHVLFVNVVWERIYTEGPAICRHFKIPIGQNHQSLKSSKSESKSSFSSYTHCFLIEKDCIFFQVAFLLHV
jgi:hypothetical protein